MQEAQHPNKLRVLLAIVGLNQREAARESGIPEGTLRHYVAGKQVIPRRDRIKLAQAIGCDIQDLAPQYDIQEDIPKRLGSRYIMTNKRTKEAFLFEEWDGCFSFGRLKTTSVILDGDGIEAYFPANICTYYDPQPATFFEEVEQAKKQIQQEQEESKANGKPYQWNGEKYHLSKIAISREPLRESMTLNLWFKPRDHYIGLATRRNLDNPIFREKYLTEDWSTPITGFSCSMGVDITVISSDGYALLTQRGQNQSVHQNMFHTSVSEGISPSFDRGTASQAPDMYRCACRGISEELGIHEPSDFSLSDIQFLSFSVDTHYALYGLRGVVKVNKRAQEILSNWHAGVKDKMENKKVFAVLFTPQDICSFVFSHESFSPGALVCLYHSLVHEFGREQVNTVISSY
jgi:hypothetical protein